MKAPSISTPHNGNGKASLHTDWIADILADEFKLFSRNLHEHYPLPREGSSACIQYQGQTVSLQHAIGAALGRIGLLYNKSARTVHRAWTQYCLLHKIHQAALFDLIDVHEQSLDHLKEIILLRTGDPTYEPFVEQLQAEAGKHANALIRLQAKMLTLP